VLFEALSCPDTELGSIEIYQTEDDKTQIEVLLNKESLWLNLQQIATLFDRDKSVISRHLGNIFNIQNRLDSLLSTEVFQDYSPFQLHKMSGVVKNQ
jgi:hypothetical protein